MVSLIVPGAKSFKAVLTFATLSLGVLAASPSQAAVSTTFYGLQADANGHVKLLSVDPVNSSGPTTLYDTGLLAATPTETDNSKKFGLNAFAYEPAAKGVFFINPADLASCTGVSCGRQFYYAPIAGAGAADVRLLGNFGAGAGGLDVRNGVNQANFYSGAFYGDTFYSIVNNDFNSAGVRLLAAQITYDAFGQPNGLGAVNLTPIVDATGAPTLPSLPYGDIAINPNTATLYGVSSIPSSGDYAGKSVVYKIELGAGNKYTLLNTLEFAKGGEGLQLAFDSQNNKLYGVIAQSTTPGQSGQWYLIDTDNGSRTLLGNGFSSPGFYDLSGGGPRDVPGPLPFLGAGMAFATSRKLRRRISASKISG